MKVHILNRNEFDHLLVSRYDRWMDISKDINNCYISIHNWNDPALSEDNRINYMNLWFDDITDKDKKTIFCDNMNLFDEEHAHRIIEFLEQNKDKKNLAVHCSAGICRSGAVGLFANDNYGEEKYEEFHKKHPWIHPNPWVMRILNREFRKKYNLNM